MDEGPVRAVRDPGRALAHRAPRCARALEALDAFGAPYVVKADGLAAGKGVVIAEDRGEAVAALEACLVERRLRRGRHRPCSSRSTWRVREVSAFALTDGTAVVPLVMAQDFKRVGDGDTGPNTGGMGAYSPVPFVDRRGRRTDLGPAVFATAGAQAEGIDYRGVCTRG